MDKSKEWLPLGSVVYLDQGGKAQHHPGLCFSRTGFEQALGAQTGRA